MLGFKEHIVSEKILAIGNAGSEKIYIDSQSGGVFAQYTSHADM